MVNSKDPDTDVLIVGAGPTGLTLACELARHGITPRIIDKAHAPSDKSKAFGIHARTLELFDNIGIADTVLSKGNICNGLDMYNEGRPLASVILDTLPSKYPFFLILAQSDTERILTEHLSSYGIEIEREKEFLGFDERDNSVIATLLSKDGSREEIICGYLAGCDGAHSTVRHCLNLDFKGAPYPDYWLLADCDLEWRYPLHHLSVFIHPSGVTAYFPLYKDRGRLMFELPQTSIDEDMAPPTMDDVHRLMGEREIDYTSATNPNWLAYFKLHHRMVDRYGYGRVFLAGDSAHIHSPLGGQGMNTGIQDAYNLAWKMALVLKGNSPETILDSYNTERYKVGKGVVELTDTATKMATIHNPVLSAIRNKAIGILSRMNAVQEKIITTLSQIEIHYKDSPIVEERWFESKEAPGYTPHPHDLRAGERVKDYLLQSPDSSADTIDLYKLFRGAEHELLIFTGTEPEDMELKEIAAIYELVTNDYSDLIELHLILGSAELMSSLPEVPSTWVDKNLEMHRDFGAAKASLYLIRPDGYIGFRNQPASASDLKEYLSTIFIL